MEKWSEKRSGTVCQVVRRERGEEEQKEISGEESD